MTTGAQLKAQARVLWEAAYAYPYQQTAKDKLTTLWSRVSAFPFGLATSSITSYQSQASEIVSTKALAALKSTHFYSQTLTNSLHTWTCTKRFKSSAEALTALDALADNVDQKAVKASKYDPTGCADGIVLAARDLRALAQGLRTLVQQEPTIQADLDRIIGIAIEELVASAQTGSRIRTQELSDSSFDALLESPSPFNTPTKSAPQAAPASPYDKAKGLASSLGSWFGSAAASPAKKIVVESRSEFYTQLPEQVRQAIVNAQTAIRADIQAQKRTLERNIISMSVDYVTKGAVQLLTSGTIHLVTAWGIKTFASTVVQLVAQPATEVAEEQLSASVANTCYLLFYTTLVVSYATRLAIWKREHNVNAAENAAPVIQARFPNPYATVAQPTLVDRTIAAAQGVVQMGGNALVDLTQGIANLRHRLTL